jgi:hypothetical protein
MTYRVIRAVAYRYFPFRDEPPRVFLGRIAEEEGPLVNAEMSLVVNGIHVRNLGCGIKRAGTIRTVNFSIDSRPCSRVAIPKEPKQSPQQENDDLV